MTNGERGAEQLRKFREQNPTWRPPRWKLRLGFPKEGTPEQQAAWFRDEFLRLAWKESDPGRKIELLKRAFAAALRAMPPRSDSANSQAETAYREFLERQIAQREGEIAAQRQMTRKTGD